MEVPPFKVCLGSILHSLRNINSAHEKLITLYRKTGNYTSITSILVLLV